MFASLDDNNERPPPSTNRASKLYNLVRGAYKVTVILNFEEEEYYFDATRAEAIEAGIKAVNR